MCWGGKKYEITKRAKQRKYKTTKIWNNETEQLSESEQQREFETTKVQNDGSTIQRRYTTKKVWRNKSTENLKDKVFEVGLLNNKSGKQRMYKTTKVHVMWCETTKDDTKPTKLPKWETKKGTEIYRDYNTCCPLLASSCDLKILVWSLVCQLDIVSS